MSRMEHSSVREKRGQDVLEKGRRWVKDGEMRDGENGIFQATGKMVGRGGGVKEDNA